MRILSDYELQLEMKKCKIKLLKEEIKMLKKANARRKREEKTHASLREKERHA